MDDVTMVQLAEYGLAAEGIDLGQSVRLDWFVDQAGNVVGAFRRHPREGAAEEECTAIVLFDTPAGRAVNASKSGNKLDIHTVVRWRPLTLTPSLRCRACKSHGFVRDGRWEWA